MRYVECEYSERRFTKIGLGTWQFGSKEWGYGADYDDREAGVIVRRALELGVRLFDTAEMYGFGRSERILGEALRAGLEETGVERDEIVVATKFFPAVPVGAVAEQRGVASAARLGTGPIDLYQIHAANPLGGDATMMRGMRDLQKAGVVRQVGVSNYSTARWRRAEHLLGAPVVSNQVEYSLLSRAPERDMLAYAQRHDRIVLAYSPLAQGLLSGRYDADNPPSNPVRAMNPLFQPAGLRAVRPLLQTLAEVADAHDATSAQVALAWSIHHPAVAAIPGASSVAQLEANVAAAEIELGGDEYRALSEAAARVDPPGRREMLRAMVHRVLRR
jgi:aryl-alcohol dehydrogenase-like predicted oxidoreductase